jgi:phosphonate transport system substrate-binding protein
MLSKILSIGAVALFCVLAAPASAQGTLKVSAIPDESPTELQRKFVPGNYPSSRPV